MNRFRKGASVAIALALTLSVSVSSADIASAATKKVKLSSKSVKLTVGKTKKITLKNSKKKVKWSIKSGKKYIKLTKKKKTSVTIKAVKKGSATVLGKVGSKKYTCKVTVVNKKTTTPTTTDKDTNTSTSAATATAAPTATPAPTATGNNATTAPTTQPGGSDATEPASTPNETPASTDDTSVTPTAEPTATPVPVKSVSVSPKTAELVLTEDNDANYSTVQLTAAVAPSRAANKNVTWTSSDSSIATVDENGLVTAVSETGGKVTITVTTQDGAKTATCAVTVLPKINKEDQSTYPETTKFEVAETKSVTKTAKNYQPEVSSVYTIEPEVNKDLLTITSDDDGVAKVTEENTVIGIGTGTTTVHVTLGEVEKTCVVTVKKTTVAIHDPSVFKDPINKDYYVVGTEMGEATSKDLQEWSSSTSGAALFKNGIKEVQPLFDYTGSTNASQLWAGDMIYNTELKKYCIYVCATGEKSITGASFAKTAICMLSSDSPTGPYEWGGMIVCADFFSTEDMNKTNIREALGLKSTDAIPDRYLNTTGTDTLSGIDPNPYYDDKGNLYLVYGSFTGGATVNILKLDPKTGLRNPAYNYDLGQNTDPYFGKVVSAQNYGEGPYILKVENENSSTGYYYYLWTSSGILRGSGTYQMGYARSENPDGPFVDKSGKNAINSGKTLVQYHYKFSFMNYACTAMGGNSALYDPDLNKYFLVYHNKFSDNTVDLTTVNGAQKNPGWHMVKVHQMFFTEDGWPLYTPFEYHGEEIAAAYNEEQVAGDYEFILHKTTGLNGSITYQNKPEKPDNTYEYNESTQLTLGADHKVTGSLTGIWALSGHTLTITTSNDVTYTGVVLEQYEDDGNYTGDITSNDKTIVFTAVGTNNVNIWGSKVTATDTESVEYDLNKLSVPSSAESDFSVVTKGLYASDITWTSSVPTVIAIDGTTAKVTLPDKETKVTLTASAVKGEAEKKTKTFEVTVPAYSITLQSMITENMTLSLPAKSAQGTDITWTSSNEEVINPTTGAVTVPDSRVSVTLTASYGDVTTPFVIVVGTIEYQVVLTRNYEEENAQTAMHGFTSSTSATIVEGASFSSKSTNNHYLQHLNTSTGGGARNASETFASTEYDFSDVDDYKVEFDLKMNEGKSCNSESQFVLFSNADVTYSVPKNITTSGITSGYILKLATTDKGANYTINDQAGTSVSLPKDGWVHISATVMSAKNVFLTIDNGTETPYQVTVPVSVNGHLGGFLGVIGRGGDGTVCVDNLTVSVPKED